MVSITTTAQDTLSSGDAYQAYFGQHLSWPKKIIAGLTMGLALVALPSGASADVTLAFGTYASDKPLATLRTFRPFLTALEASLTAELGEPVKIKTKISSDYAKGIQALVSGRVDFARFGPASYVVSKSQNAGISILAIEAVKGRKRFNGVICVRANSEIQRLADLRGLSFAFGSKFSTIGRYLAQSMLLDAGISAVNLSNYSYLGRHDKVGHAVANGQFDAGALKEGTFNKLKKQNLPIRKLMSFSNVTKPWIARNGLPKHLVVALRKVLLEFKNTKALKAIKKSGFLPGSDRDYDIIRDSINENTSFGAPS